MAEVPIRQADLARAAGVKPASVAQWRNGRTKEIAGETLLLAAAALQCSPKWLATGVGPINPAGQPGLPGIPAKDEGLDEASKEVLRLFQSLPKAGREEALTVLRYVAAKHGSFTTTGSQQRDPVPSASKRAA
ncbi:helix-turn-helix domain-containing protein [Variovorax sp. 375MFSha3.1]|uniref:helix-turn-helix domain-containing protein n=1 Tax=Variovorax sp. 375MFSha3.1 TaxID=3158364 RepID=UPI003AAFCC4B